MATIRGEYSTIYDIRSSYLSIVGTTDDALLLDLLRSVCRDIDKACGQELYPLVETRSFDYGRQARGNKLILDKPLLAVTTLTNGDSTAITSAQYVFEPRNSSEFPKWKIELLASTGITWQYNTDYQNAISLAGIWGYHARYNDAWQTLTASSDSVTAVTVNETYSASDTTLTISAASNGKAGQLWKIESEYIYVGALTTTTASQIVRGVNGSTAASHASGTAITVWTVDESLAQLTKEATTARYRLRGNPLADNFVALDGSVLVNPKDIDKYITRRVNELGLVRTPV